MLRTLLFLLCLAAGSRQLSMTEFVVPAALEAGENAELLCKYDLLKNESEKSLFVKWWWTPLNEDDDSRYPLYQRIAGHSAVINHRFQHYIEMLKDDGLLLKNVTHKVSGVYECEVSNIDEVRKHKKLIVYSMGRGPLLNISVSEDDAERNAFVTCEAFDVAPRAYGVITLNGIAVESSRYISDVDDDLFDVYENSTVPLNEADNGEFRCEIVFEDDEVLHDPYIVSQTFIAPTASTPEPEEPTTEPSAAANQPYNNGSDKTGDSWILLTSFSLLTVLLGYCSK